MYYTWTAPTGSRELCWKCGTYNGKLKSEEVLYHSQNDVCVSGLILTSSTICTFSKRPVLHQIGQTQTFRQNMACMVASVSKSGTKNIDRGHFDPDQHPLQSPPSTPPLQSP